jgi:hypothetical protein
VRSAVPRLGCRLAGIPGAQKIEEVADLLVHLSWMTHLCAAVDRVVIATTDLPALDEACLDEVRDDSLGRTLGDPHLLGHVAKPHVSVTSDAEEHLGVIGDEPPGFSASTT